MRYPSIFIIVFFFINQSFAQKIIHLDASFPYHNIGAYTRYLEDKTGKLNLADVKKLDQQGKFQVSNLEILSLGNKRAAFWINIQYINQSNSKAFLVLDASNIEKIDVYFNAVDGTPAMLHSGSLASESPRVIASNNYIFNLADSSPGIQSVYIRVMTNNLLVLPIKLATSETLIANGPKKARYESLYIGALVILFLFNLFLYLSFKDHTYLYYSLYVGAFFVYLIFYLRGYSYFFGADFRRFINLYPHLFLSISCISSAIFSIKFLDMKRKLPQLLIGYRIVIGLWGTVFLMSLLGYKAVVAGLVGYLIFISSVFFWFTGIRSYLKGHKPALYYILAWGFLSISILWITLVLFGVFPYTDSAFYIVPAGTTIELLLLSFALGARFNDIRKQNLSLVNSQKARLEKLVQGRTLKLNQSVSMLKERTFELDRTVKTLEHTNAVKNKLFSIIAHDLRSPFHSLMSIFSLKDMNALDFEELKMLLNESRKNIENIHTTLDNLLYWAKSQMDGVTARPELFDLNLILNELMSVYQPLSDRKFIEIILSTPEALWIYADPNQIQLVLRNLFDNAIKFTPLQQRITIAAHSDSTSAHICISNPVLDITKINVESFSTGESYAPAYGTDNERGVGLGLHLCREFIFQNAGKFHVNIEDEQVLFSFTLPKQA
jgi:signal transduction histidine kinase